MEPVTHFLTGACLGRAGLNRRTAWATFAATLAAEAADFDEVSRLGGPFAELGQHRGYTHTLWALPVIAAAVVACVWLLDRIAAAWRRRQNRRGLTRHGEIRAITPPQPIRWAWLFLTAFIAASSHLMLDWTNNYGVRVLYPLDSRWTAGSFVFIIEPLLWLMLGGALLLPLIFRLIDHELGARRQLPPRGWAIAALIGMVALWGVRMAARDIALTRLSNLQLTELPVQRVAVEPYPLNPFRWHAILETADRFQTAEVDLRRDAIESDPHVDVQFKPPVTPATLAARQSAPGRTYLDWSSWPLVRDLGPVPVPGIDPPQLVPGRHWTTVEFTDLRFSYAFLGPVHLTSRKPLTAYFYVVDGHEVASASLNGKEQR